MIQGFFKLERKISVITFSFCLPMPVTSKTPRYSTMVRFRNLELKLLYLNFSMKFS